MSQVRRTDLLDLGSERLTPELRAMLAPPRKTRDGFLVLEGFAARSGVQSYMRADGSIVREYRPPEEVHGAEALASYVGLPVTDDHPPTFVTTANAREHSRGAVLRADAIPEHGLNKVQVAIHDAELIRQLDAGKRQLSLGYYIDLDETPGVTAGGERYDRIQRGLDNNHLAVVHHARAGERAQLRLDAAGDLLLGTTTTQETAMSKTTITIGGAQVLIPEDGAQAVINAVQAMEQSHQAALQAQTQRADSLAGEVKALKADAASQRTDAEEIQKRVDERLALLQEATPLLPEKYIAAGKTEAQIRKDACEHAWGQDFTEAEATGAYKLLVAKYKQTSQARQDALSATSGGGAGGQAPSRRVDADEAYKSFVASHQWDHEKGRNQLA